MIEPVALADFFTVFFSAAMLIMAGAAYALLYAYARLRGLPKLMPLAYAAYAGLVVSVWFLADAANLLHNGFWLFIVVLMLFVAGAKLKHLLVIVLLNSAHRVYSQKAFGRPGPRPPRGWLLDTLCSPRAPGRPARV